MKIYLSSLIFVLISNLAYANGMTSAYTKLDGPNCQKIDDYSIKCPGAGKYDLIIQEDDSRVSLVVVMPGEKEVPLQFWDVVTGHLTSLGEFAEWRFANGETNPHALIVRLTVYPFEENDKKNKSILVITKLTNNGICVTDKINGQQANANWLARSLADQSYDKPCLK